MASAKSAILAIAVAAIVIAASAAAYVVLTSDGDTGTIRILIKDAPDDWSHVNVTFSKVTIHRADAGNESGWKAVTLMSGTIDLVPLTNMSALLAENNVSVGKYTQIRIYVLSAVGVMTNGTTVNFEVPSDMLRANHPFNITADRNTSITVDIDLSKSIVHADGKWIFKPVLGPVTTDSH